MNHNGLTSLSLCCNTYQHTSGSWLIWRTKTWGLDMCQKFGNISSMYQYEHWDYAMDALRLTVGLMYLGKLRHWVSLMALVNCSDSVTVALR